MAGRSDPNTQENTRMDASPKDKTGAATGRMTERQWVAQQALDAARSGDEDRSDILLTMPRASIRQRSKTC